MRREEPGPGCGSSFDQCARLLERQVRERDDRAEAFFNAMRAFVIAYCRQTYECIFLLGDYFGGQADRFAEQGADFQTAVALQLRRDLSELRQQLVLVPRGLTYEHRTSFVSAAIRHIVASGGAIPKELRWSEDDVQNL